jgi:site-specific DNA-cytosine methylase
LWYSKRRRAQNDQDFETWIEGGVCPTLNAFDNTGDSRATVLIIDGTRVDDVRVYEGPVQTLKERMGTGGNNVPIIAVDETILFDADRRVGARVFEDGIAPTLMAFMGTGGNNVPFVTFGIDGYNQTISDGVYHTIDARTHKGDDLVATENSMQVRRLTPIECERLMGWPDNHTLPRTDGKQNPDTTRYKMCGNGVASPVAQWIGQNLMEIMGGQ